MKRKLLSAALIGAMLVTSVPAFAANENTGGTSLPFTDVADGAWYYDAVVYAYDKGLMTGTSATEFAPDVTMTRGMIASVLYRLEGNPAMSDATSAIRMRKSKATTGTPCQSTGHARTAS